VKRLRSAWQIYSVLYYHVKLKNAIKLDWITHYEATPNYNPEIAKPKPPLWYRNQRTRELYAEESPEVVAEVEDKLAEEKSGKDAKGDDEDEDGLDAEVTERKRLAKLEGYRVYATTTTPSFHGCLLRICPARVKPSQEVSRQCSGRFMKPLVSLER
jgi:hypothetical protein